MNTITAVLVDDEPDTLETMQLLVKKHCPDVEVLGSFGDPMAAIREIPQLKPELLFLDIQMPGITGWTHLTAALFLLRHIIRMPYGLSNSARLITCLNRLI
jgi:two-component system LytT family response regulator